MYGNCIMEKVQIGMLIQVCTFVRDCRVAVWFYALQTRISRKINLEPLNHGLWTGVGLVERVCNFPWNNLNAQCSLKRLVPINQDFVLD